MLNDRNMTPHMYKKEMAEEIAGLSGVYHLPSVLFQE